MKRLILAGALLLGTAHADPFPPPPPGARFEAFVLNFGGPSAPMPVGEALVIHEDGSITVDWARLRAYAALYPAERTTWLPPDCAAAGTYAQVSCVLDYQQGQTDMHIALMVHALLALHDGRVTDVRP